MWYTSVNPLRYRGYVYDPEYKIYYLESRYYNPGLGRFQNADAFASTGQGLLGNNMYIYCNNNPVNLVDPNGNIPYATNQFRSNALYDGGNPFGNFEYIKDQKANGVGDRKFGVTTVSHGGCGSVATYNALITLGEPTSFNSVLKYYNGSYDRTIAGGLLGMLPHQVADYFESKGYRVIMSSNPDGIDVFSKTADACILWYAYPASYGGIDMFGAHFVHYRKYGNGYIAYNTGYYGSETFQYPSDFGDRGNRYGAIGIFIYN